MTPVSQQDLLACAEAAARAAGEHALRHQSRRQEALVRTDHDVKLVLDHECQALAEKVIRARVPDHHFMGEEGGSVGDGSQPQWIVDPIDGTVNFSHGLHYWCNSVAVQVGGRTVAAAVFAPTLSCMYAATADGPATCNGEVIRVSDTADLRQALALTGIERNFDQYPQSAEVACAIVQQVQKVRLLGAAALDLCQVAHGRVDAFYESGINLWDIAAGVLIIERAGGCAETIARLPSGRLRMIAANRAIFPALRALLQNYPAWWNPA